MLSEQPGASGAQHGVGTIAFPAISTGAYGFLLERATRIAVAETERFLEREASIKSVTFVCFSQRDLGTYRAVLREG